MLGRNPPPRDHDHLIERFFTAAAKRAPELQNLAITHRVTAQQTIGGDGMPYVGEIEDGLWAVAFVGHGVMHGPPIAQALAQAALGQPDPSFDLSIWNPRRRLGEWTVLWRSQDDRA
jgi:glycine/D-amino acid oxidase-like deaminating enzyme